jgi:hypothetical protein
MEGSDIWFGLVLVQSSVAGARADIFAIFGNKIAKNLKIFGEVDHLKILRSLSQL